MRLFIAILSISLIFASCTTNEMQTFNPMTNFPDTDTVCLDMDLDNVVLNGITIPSINQTPSGFFYFQFDTIAPTKLYYKIYYQNDSYKFLESDSLAYENFYGSWEEDSIGFKPVPHNGHICDSFRIVGNPRNEQRYYGADISHLSIRQSDIKAVEEAIMSDSVWYNSIIEKSKINGFSVRKQLFLDAQWILSDKRHSSGTVNHRWKRNPRVGCYSFMLVICDSIALQTIPTHIQYIGQLSPNGQYQNPYSWYAKRHRNITLLQGNKILKTRAVITPQSGLYVDMLSVQDPDCDFSIAEQNGLLLDSMYSNALFQQFFPAVSQQYTLRNIPVIDTLESYTLSKYQFYQNHIDSSQLHYTYPQVSSLPGSTVVNHGDNISIINPAATAQRMVKESTGVKSRVGFTYGKFRGKLKFPPMLNKHQMWNGLTYAFWLIYQDNNEWNNRRPSYRGGYIDKGDESDNPQRKTNNYYSEIDIEIVKTSPYWPDNNAPDNAMSTNQVAFACTNWDLACPEPSAFSSGISNISHNGNKYQLMRWYDTYKALTLKSMIDNQIFDSSYYYYEIEWRPTEIIWRLGPSPHHLTEVGYMNHNYTNIPNNQMLCVVTQEYHYSEWWPPIVFHQGLIPYSANPIEGHVYEIVIE